MPAAGHKKPAPASPGKIYATLPAPDAQYE
ncbi:hypothetical protein EC5905_2343, partial [Escherichia coli 5905]